METIIQLRKKPISCFFIIIFIILLSVTNLFAEELYDLCYSGELLKEGKFLFVRYRNALLDPVLRTYEIYLYSPFTGKITFLQKKYEQIYILPAVSRDRSTVNYHSLIEGTDFLVTRNLETGKSTRLRFDTSGYFVDTAIHYDNDSIASILKRGENRQAIYIISNKKGTIRRIFNGRDFQEIGFLNNGNIYYVDHINDQRVMGVVRKDGRRSTKVAEGIDYIRKAPNGDAILYSKGSDLFLYRVNNNESIKITGNFNRESQLPLLAPDGSTCAVYEKNAVLIVNIPSGDIMYFLSFDTQNSTGILTNFTFYTSKQRSVLHIKYKKPAQYLAELFKDNERIRLMGGSPNDRFLLYQKENDREINIYDRSENRTYSREFLFTIQNVFIPSSPAGSFYMRTLSQEEKTPLRELYFYNYEKKTLVAISTAVDTDIHSYLRNE